MKKSTVLILIIVYLGSIFIVGVYGLKAKYGNETVYCEKITPTQITLSTGDVFKGEDILKDENAEDPNTYMVIISSKKFTAGLTATIAYELTPSDCTYNGKDDIEITDVTSTDGEPAAIIDSDGRIVFFRKAAFDVRFTAKDQAPGAQMTIRFMFGR